MRGWAAVVTACFLAGCGSSAERTLGTSTVVEAAPTTAPPAAPPETTTTTLPPTTTTGPAPTSTTAAAPGRTVPAVIDKPYVQQVLTTLHHLIGEAAGHLKATGRVDAEVTDRLQAVLGGSALRDVTAIFQDTVKGGDVRLANPPGDPTAELREIVSSSATCLLVRAVVDTLPLYDTRLEPDRHVSIVQLTAVPGVGALNPTGWGIVAVGDPAPGTNLKICG